MGHDDVAKRTGGGYSGMPEGSSEWSGVLGGFGRGGARQGGVDRLSLSGGPRGRRHHRRLGFLEVAGEVVALYIL